RRPPIRRLGGIQKDSAHRSRPDRASHDGETRGVWFGPSDGVLRRRRTGKDRAGRRRPGLRIPRFAAPRRSKQDLSEQVGIPTMAQRVSKRHLSRRTFLRGTGVALALPWLDAMLPAFATR